MDVKILSVKKSPFQGDDGPVDYFWYKAVRKSDGVHFEFGSRDGAHPIGEETTLDIEKYETSNGKIRYKEVVGRVE